MVDTVNFSTTVGGDGTIITNDHDAATGIKGGGHVPRFVKSLSQLVAVAGFVVTKATEVTNEAGIAVIARNDAEAAKLDAEAAAASAIAAASGITGKEDASNKSTSVATDAASNTKYPSVKSVYDWVSGNFAASGGIIGTVLTGFVSGSGTVSAADTVLHAIEKLDGNIAGVLTAQTEGNLIASATVKTTPIDADYVGLMDSAAGNILKKLSWSNVKATLKTYFDTLYAPLSQPYDVGAFYPGVPSASAVFCLHVFNRPVLFPSSLTSSHGLALVAATSQTDFDIIKNSTSIGTMRFAAAATTATFIAASSTSFAAGDVLKVVAPSTPDATLENITFLLSGIR